MKNNGIVKIMYNCAHILGSIVHGELIFLICYYDRFQSYS